ncbi:uncharacterized protein EAE97_002124 [Botrytis byssoidea]|uniref:Uncharacterized protein n=1 Tax=Botrytis byssoidea TaxID=139641 RepID=A0A9P5IQI2_9HELO|nr:uncharacterized protein EAE97_002124 [Botrytis byssoidea]KAF7950572.1 hypothetical protein EAE97_002124 [Botrytis byssoidea]
MSSPPRKLTLKVLGQFDQGKEAGKQAYREVRVEALFEFQHTEEYRKGYEAGVKAEENLGIPGTEEWTADRIAKEAKKAKELELFKRIAERKAKEARRIKEAIETAHRDAVMFHREFDTGGILEIHGPRAQLDKDGQIQGGLERKI